MSRRFLIRDIVLYYFILKNIIALTLAPLLPKLLLKYAKKGKNNLSKIDRGTGLIKAWGINITILF